MRLARYALLLTLLPGCLPAATLTWPGNAPCAGTLQACIVAAAAADTVIIDSDALIEESPVFGKALTLRAAPGRRPVLAAGRNIHAVLPASGLLNLEGLALIRGRVLAEHTAGSGTIRIRHMRVLSTEEGEEAIRIVGSSPSGTLTYQIYANEVRHSHPSNDLAIRGAIAVESFNGGQLTGTIEANQVEARGVSSYGIALMSGGNLEARVLGNQVRGGQRGGLYCFIGSGGGSMTSTVINNVLTPSAPGARDGHGIHGFAQGGSMTLNVYNNTVVDSSFGLALAANAGASLNGAAINNLFAYNTVGVSIPAGLAASFPNRYNLVHGSASNAYTPGFATLTVDPLLVSRHEPRLRASSPARDAGNSQDLDAQLFAHVVADLDGDGLRRFNGTVDIGAYESGSFSYTHRNTPANTLNSGARLSHPRLDGIADARPQATPNATPANATGSFNNHHSGLYYSSGAWFVFNQDNAALANNAAFNVFSPALRATHSVNGAGAAVSLLDFPETFLQSDYLVMLTPHWNAVGNGVFNNHPIGTLYFSDRWSIANLDFQFLLDGADFDVYYQPLSVNAFVHSASGANRTGTFTFLDHRLLNNTPCAAVQVSQTGNGGAFNAHPIGVFYAAQRQQWAIFNQDETDMPDNVSFHVLVDPAQVAECKDRIFDNSYEH